MNRKLRNTLLIALAVAAFVAWVVFHNLYPPKPRLPAWFRTPADARVLALSFHRGSAAAGRGDVYARILYPGDPATVVDSIMKACKSNGYSPQWDPDKPGHITPAQRKYHAQRLDWLGKDYTPPTADAVVAHAQHAFADQTGVIVFASPANAPAPATSPAGSPASMPASVPATSPAPFECPGPLPPPMTIVDLFFTGAF